MNTSSWNFPNMINIAQNSIGILQDSNSIKNRLALLIKTEPTELFMNPEFGVGLKQYMWQYNNDTMRPIIEQKLTDKITQFEPSVIPESIEFKQTHDASITDATVTQEDANTFNITIVMQTNYGDTIEITI